MFRKNDALLLLAVALLAAGAYGVARWTATPFFGSADMAGAQVQVLVDGVERLRLPAGAIGQHEVPQEGDAQNRIELTGQGVRMLRANCPDQWCVRKGTVAPGADAIVCLPHRLIVRWERAAALDMPEEVDVVLQ